MAALGLDSHKDQIAEWCSQVVVSPEDIVQRLKKSGHEYNFDQVEAHLKQWNLLTAPLSTTIEVETSRLLLKLAPCDLEVSSSSDISDLHIDLQLLKSTGIITPQILSGLPSRPTSIEKYCNDDRRNDPFTTDAMKHEFPEEAAALITESRYRLKRNISNIIGLVGNDAEDTGPDVHGDVELSSASEQESGDIAHMQDVPNIVDPTITKAGNSKYEDHNTDAASQFMNYQVRTAEQITAGDRATSEEAADDDYHLPSPQAVRAVKRAADERFLGSRSSTLAPRVRRRMIKTMRARPHVPGDQRK